MRFLALALMVLTVVLTSCGGRHSPEADYENVYSYLEQTTHPPARYHAGNMSRVFPSPQFDKEMPESMWEIHQYRIEDPVKGSYERLDTFVISRYGRVSRLADVRKELFGKVGAPPVRKTFTVIELSLLVLCLLANYLSYTAIKQVRWDAKIGIVGVALLVVSLAGLLPTSTYFNKDIVLFMSRAMPVSLFMFKLSRAMIEEKLTENERASSFLNKILPTNWILASLFVIFCSVQVFLFLAR
jgi:hypothetical protein